MADMIEIPRQYLERRLDEIINAEQEIERLRAEKIRLAESIEELTELTREVIDMINPHTSEYKCDLQRDWARNRLREILGIVDDD